MSADNWTYCPKCSKQRVLTQERLDRSVEEAYGKIPQEKYMELVEARNNPPRLQDTLREDYEVGIYDAGRFFISYKAQCTVCGFTFSYRHEEEIEI